MFDKKNNSVCKYNSDTPGINLFISENQRKILKLPTLSLFKKKKEKNNKMQKKKSILD